MKRVGTYSERLPYGGELKVNGTGWGIEYYWSGPDLRYNGTFFRIEGNSVDAYIRAYIANWEDYERLRMTIPEGGRYSKFGEMGMKINVRGWPEGVCLKDYHMAISSKKQLDGVIEAYRYAQK